MQGPENIRSTILWLAFVLFCGWIVFNAILPNNDLNIGSSVLVIVFTWMTLFFYGAAAAKALWSGSFKYTDWLIVGICLGMFATQAREFLVLVARLGNLSPTFLNSEWWVPIKLLYPIACVCHVLPRGAADGDVPRGNKWAVGLAFVVAAVLASTLLVVHPSTQQWINGMPGWMKDFWGTGQASAPAPRAA